MVEPLDLEHLFVNIFAGSRDIFFFIAVIFLAFLGAKLRMMNETFLLMLGLFVIFLAGAGYATAFYAIIIFLAGLFFYSILSKIFKY